MSTGLYQTHFSRSGDVIHPRNCENLGLGTRLFVRESGRHIYMYVGEVRWAHLHVCRGGQVGTSTCM